jgi:hypothetical protein
MWGTPKSAVRTYGTYKVPACARSYGRGMRREQFTLLHSLSARTDCNAVAGEP